MVKNKVASRWLSLFILRSIKLHFCFLLSRALPCFGSHVRPLVLVTSGRQPVVKIIAELLLQHDEEYVPTSLCGIRIRKRSIHAPPKITCATCNDFLACNYETVKIIVSMLIHSVRREPFMYSCQRCQYRLY
jgi:hypothetical protein